MKIILWSLLWVMMYPALACDICSGDNSGSGLSITGHDVANQVGVKYMYKYIRLDNPVDDTREMQVEYLEMHASYMPHKRVAITISLPYIWQYKQAPSMITKTNGLGDMSLGMSVKLFDILGKKENRAWENNLFLAGGLEMPTGIYVIPGGGYCHQADVNRL